MPVVDELVTILGLEADSSAEREAGKVRASLASVRDWAVKAGVALTGAAVAIGAYTKSVAAAVDEGGKFAASVGISYEALQELEFATERSGGSVEELRGDLQSLTQTLSSPVPGEFNQQLALMGISARGAGGELKNSTQVLEELALKFERYNAVEAQQIGAKLGLSQSTIRLLQNGADGVAQLRAEARALGGVIPTEATLQAAEFNDRLTDVQFAIKGIAQTAAIALFPALTDSLAAARDFFVANRAIISSGLEQFARGVVQGFQQFFKVVAAITDAVSEFLAPLGDMAGNLDTVDVFATAVTAALTGLAGVLIIIIAKFVLIGAAIAAVVLVVEDLITWFRGGESIIGGFFESILAYIDKAIEKFNAFRELIVDKIGGALSSVADFFGFGSDGAQAAAPGSTAPIPSSIINNSQSSNASTTNNFTINGAGDPRSVAAEVAARSGASQTLQTATPGQLAPTLG